MGSDHSDSAAASNSERSAGHDPAGALTIAPSGRSRVDMLPPPTVTSEIVTRPTQEMGLEHEDGLLQARLEMQPIRAVGKLH